MLPYFSWQRNFLDKDDNGWLRTHQHLFQTLLFLGLTTWHLFRSWRPPGNLTIKKASPMNSKFCSMSCIQFWDSPVMLQWLQHYSDSLEGLVNIGYPVTHSYPQHLSPVLSFWRCPSWPALDHQHWWWQDTWHTAHLECLKWVAACVRLRQQRVFPGLTNEWQKFQSGRPVVS